MALDAASAFGELAPRPALLLAQRQAAVGAARRAAALPAYRAAFAGAGLSAETITAAGWDELPFLTKDALIEGAAAEPPFGGRLAVTRTALAHVFVAPGPLYMPFTAGDMEHVAGSFAKAFRACGLVRGDLVDQTTMYNWVIAATAIDRALAAVGCAVVPGGVGQSERHVEVIRRLGVDAVVAFPTFLEHLLDLAGSEPLPLRKAVVMGELSNPQAKARLRSRHGLVAREFYGVADVGAVAWECEASDGMHLRDDLLVEWAAPGGGAVDGPRPGAPAEIVVTDFHRQAMPIIRLRTGDVVEALDEAPCACGRSGPRIRRIAGRASEITKVKGMFVVPRQVGDVLRRHGVERPFRLVVERPEGGRDALTLEIEGGPPLPEAGPLQAAVEQALRLRVDLRMVPALPTDGPRLVDRRLGG